MKIAEMLLEREILDGAEVISLIDGDAMAACSNDRAARI